MMTFERPPEIIERMSARRCPRKSSPGRGGAADAGGGVGAPRSPVLCAWLPSGAVMATLHAPTTWTRLQGPRSSWGGGVAAPVDPETPDASATITPTAAEAVSWSGSVGHARTTWSGAGGGGGKRAG